MRNILKVNNATVNYVKQGTFRYVQQVMQEGLGIRYGDAISSFIEAEVYYKPDGTQEINEGDRVLYFQELDVDEDFAPINTPVLQLIRGFNVKKVIKLKSTYSFVAYDNLELLNASYSEHLFDYKSSFPDNLQAVLDQLVYFASQELGVTIEISELDAYNLSTPMSQIMDYFYTDGISYKDILSHLAELSCQYLQCDSIGQIHFKRFSTTADGTPAYWRNSDRYIIAPTDQVTYTGTALINGTSQTVTLFPVFYKQDGLLHESFAFKGTQDLLVKNIRGETWHSIDLQPKTVNNPYIIQKNPFIDKLTLTTAGKHELFDWGFASVNSLLSRSITPVEVHLFPFRNPFNAGQILPHIEDASGNRFASVVMKLEQTDSEVILTCSGQEYYYTSASENYDNEENAQFLNVAVNDLYENKVEKSGDTMTGTLKLPTVSPRAIEMTPLDGATNGGYIDFHYAGSSADYTSRIIENASGTIKIFGNLELSSPLAVTQGGTGSTAVVTTSTITDIASAGGNTTITGATYAEWGKVASVQIIIKRSVNTGTNTDVTVATLVSGKRPAITSPAIVRYNGSNVFSYVASDGGIRINTATSIPANTEIIIDAVFILA